MTGFRPSFYAENPALHSIEILAWASSVPCFTFREMRDRFQKQLAGYKDPVHEASERLRKLVKTGMIAIADETRVNSTAQGHELPEPQRTAVAEKLSEIAIESKGKPGQPGLRGRPSRVYILTRGGQKQVDRRLEDLEAIAADRRKKGKK